MINCFPTVRPWARATAPRVALAFLVAASLVLGACSSGNSRSRDVAEAGSAESLYLIGKRALNQGDFLTAISTFEVLGARYPFGNFTQQAQLDIAYAYFRQGEYDNAVDSANRFIKLYPRSERLDYAYYIKGLSHFSRGTTLFEGMVPRDMARLDQSWLRAAYNEFDNLARRFPDSEYVEDAIARMQFLRNEMARHELVTARFYYQRGAMVAVVNRVNWLLEHYDGSTHVPDALALMADAYEAMGQSDLRDDTLRVLAETQPDHPALDRQRS
ncbi:MAG: outer membrane protein assembly factor BamD [Gammaproteobacteria bacterium]|nr:MAG: outer membrane protein assembly factor BamD [Gammaproteobacteria bacterium]